MTTTALANFFVTHMLTRDLFGVANFFVRLEGYMGIVEFNVPLNTV